MKINTTTYLKFTQSTYSEVESEIIVSLPVLARCIEWPCQIVTGTQELHENSWRWGDYKQDKKHRHIESDYCYLYSRFLRRRWKVSMLIRRSRFRRGNHFFASADFSGKIVNRKNFIFFGIIWTFLHINVHTTLYFLKITLHFNQFTYVRKSNIKFHQ